MENKDKLINRSTLKMAQPNRADALLKMQRLGKDDTFTFGCNQCGKCCREREDVLLTPLDVFKIAKHLDTSVCDVLDEYCDAYEGESSKIPVIRIKPKEYRKTCPFSEKGRCRIHLQKPSVCALFPLGRMTNFETGELTYILQPADCGNKNQTQTVREWLDDFSVLDEEEFTVLWHMKIGEISNIACKTYEKITFNHDFINSMLFFHMYGSYDLKKDFMPQFLGNMKEALTVIEVAADTAASTQT